ncbi:restriction endonuclease [Microvirga zambiensis]|uniref:restriction endonuclease n=1 Tax=Microvirga zambiensis TaxID=1402137 RepID=UPI00191D6E0B|nr:restriction endonuclease [Microvirga zambiensis]
MSSQILTSAPSKRDLPKFDALMRPVLEALQALGGSASIAELHDWIADYLNLSDGLRSIPYGKGGMTILQYRLHWARSYLKRVGAIENSERGIWTITDAGRQMTSEEISQVKKRVRMENRLRRQQAEEDTNDNESFDADEDVDWTTRLLNTVGQIDPSAFERLCQRILRESGFTRVDITGRSGDGGIDGIGVLRMNLVSFHVLFQCKRWKGSVGSSVVRDFRGAMVGRADKGLIITTGTFTSDARREAARDGAPAIDLVDGESLCTLLKDLKLGVKVRLVEEIEIEDGFFHSI